MELGADAVVGEKLAQDGVRLAAVDDMGGWHPFQGVQASGDFRDHAAADRAVADELPRSCRL